MDRKHPVDWSAKRILGIVFCILGGIYILLGAAMLMIPSEDPEVRTVGAVFLPLGSVLAAVGLVFYILVLRRHRAQKRLIEEGRYVWGTVFSLEPNLSIRVNRRHPMIAVVRFLDSSGVMRTFKSRNLYRYADQSLIGKQVKVYTQAPKYNPYYVDIEPLLKAYQPH